MKIAIESPKTLTEQDVEEILAVWNRKVISLKLNTCVFFFVYVAFLNFYIVLNDSLRVRHTLSLINSENFGGREATKANP